MRYFSKTRTSPRNIYIAGRSVGGGLPVDMVTVGRRGREEVEDLLKKGFIEEIFPEVEKTETEVFAEKMAEQPDEVRAQLSGRAQAKELEALVEPSPVAKAIEEEAKLAEMLEKVVYVDDPEPEALDEKPEEVEEVPMGNPADEDEEGDQGEEKEAEYDLTLLDQSVKALEEDLMHIDDRGWLEALRAAEEAGKTRKGALTVIDAAIEKLGA